MHSAPKVLIFFFTHPLFIAHLLNATTDLGVAVTVVQPIASPDAASLHLSEKAWFHLLNLVQNELEPRSINF